MGIDFAKQVVVSEYARKLIRFKAKQLSRRADFSRSDQEDIEQELTLYLFSQAATFDADRASINTFIAQVVNSGVGTILRNRARSKRSSAAEVQSLDEPVEASEDQPASLAEAISPDDLARRTGAAPLDRLKSVAQTESFTHALESMPPDLRTVCRRLMDDSVHAVARDLGISRRRVYGAINEARPYFELAGFEEIRARPGNSPTNVIHIQETDK
jgi:RNA polymerase sigma-70 factor (ECF subfamily)